MSKHVLVKFDYSRGSDSGKRCVLMEESKLKDSLMSGLDAHRNGQFRQFHANCCSNVEVYDCEVIQTVSQVDAHKTAILYGNKPDTYVIDEYFVYNLKLRDNNIVCNQLKVGEMALLMYGGINHTIIRTYNSIVSLTDPNTVWTPNTLKCTKLPPGHKFTVIAK